MFLEKINLYHVFHKMPALAQENMYVQLEKLARDLIHSGLLRIEAEPKQNFVRFSIPTSNIHEVFTKHDLFDEHLLLATKARIEKALRTSGVKQNLATKIDTEIAKLKQQLKKFLEVESEMELQIARILVQSAHPIVFMMIIHEKVQVYVSFGHSVGEVMDVAFWQQAGSNSGLQSTNGKDAAVFITCGGDPLRFDEPEEKVEEKSKEEKTHGDGKPALARMMGIAGQETGHYSDIRHNDLGQQIGRYSANFSGTRADPQVNQARLNDMKNIDDYWEIINQKGFDNLFEIEKKLQLLDQYPEKNIFYNFSVLKMKLYRFIFVLRNSDIIPLKELKDKKYIATTLKALFSDMAFNLEPKADVYSNPDKNVEIAIACIEALARVPQQVNKWGHHNTRFLWPNLYNFYYSVVIAGDIRDYEAMSGKKFDIYPRHFRKYSFTEKLAIKFDRFKA